MRFGKPKATIVESCTGYPILILVGTVSTSSAKDALAYAKGLAEAQVIAKESTYLQVSKRATDQYFYEIQEGGDGRSRLSAINAMLGTGGGLARVPLEGNRVALIREEAGEVLTLIAQPDEQAHAAAAAEFLTAGHLDQSKPVLLPALIPTCEAERKAAVYGLLAAAAFTLFTGAWQTLSSHSIDVKQLSLGLLVNKTIKHTSVENLPAMKLLEAQQGLHAPSAYLSYVRYERGKWDWAQAVAAAQLPIPAAKGPGPLLPPTPEGMANPVVGEPLQALPAKEKTTNPT